MTIEKIEAITQERLRRRIRHEELQTITNRYSISGLEHQKRSSQLVFHEQLEQEKTMLD